MSYEPPDNDQVDFTLESYEPPANDQVDFSLEESDGGGTQQEETDPFSLGGSRIELPTALDLPFGPLNIRSMNTGLALFIVGILGVLGAASAVLRNWIAGVVLGLAVVALLMSGTIGLGLEVFWSLLMLTVLMLIMGAVARVIA